MKTYHFFVSVDVDEKVSTKGLHALLQALHDKVFEALVLAGKRYKIKNVVAVTTTRLEERDEMQWQYYHDGKAE